MVQQFKSSLKFKPKDNIVKFLNNKVRETLYKLLIANYI